MYRWRYHIVLLSASLFSCHVQQNKETQHTTKESLPDVKATIFIKEDGSYGYDILVNGTVVIHQPHVPARAGDRGFPSEESARKIADQVIEKLKNKEMPPTVSVKDL